MSINPDPKYNNLVVQKFINQTMRRGKKTLAQKIVYNAFSIIQEQTKKNPLEVFSKALKNASPRMETKPKRVGGATYQVPTEVKGERQETLAMRWILETARSKKGKSMEEKLAEELILASKNEGAAIRKKINVERMAEANKAFAHLAR
ncbi:MAG TPA: 30S ribosomal protein S7 [Candidatus Pacearchaeota archaeon]|nr:30S ribosomal protein S7 [Candidatus Pacearchaeota archaeon]HOK94035.1 30S ribosomal protein S7 [Candidatus Pacearchaeota archaeon]HPO75106.1 30S ribosomal protein S7 [Candidatus Pacearchaeota archaeon]